MSNKSYDIIIAGAGLSGLSLAYYLAKGGYAGNVLLVDASFAPVNTKTWCFWSKERPEFAPVVYKEWRKTFFSAFDFDAFLYMNKYTYYCIRESDFKEYILTELRKYSNFSLLEEAVLDFTSSKKKGVMVTKSSETLIADYIFQSIVKPESADSNNLKYPLIQHFYGIDIQTKASVFDTSTFTIMDVDETFDDGFAFMYTLPFSHDRALIEYTVFSNTVLKKKEYKKKIRAFIFNKYRFTKSDYTIHRKEFGMIPMDDRPFEPMLEHNIFNIGTVGGFTKPSTGYTFSRVQNYAKKLAASIIQNGEPTVPKPSAFRYRYYDLLLLSILSESASTSRQVFHDLFKNNPIDNIFDFLDEDTRFIDDLKVMNSVPYAPFLKAIAKNISNLPF